MARVNYTGIVDSITGRIGGSVFQRNKSGFVMRGTGHTKKSTTTKQQNAHSYLAWWSNEWNLCTMQEKTDWNYFATLNTKTNPYGRIMTLTGHNWFVSVNRNRQLCGVGETLSPPTYTLPDEMPVFTTIFTDTTLTTEFTGTPSSTSQFLFIWSTPIMTNVNTSFNRLLRFQSVIQLITANSFDLLSDWQTAHELILSELDLPVNCCIGFRFQMVHRNTGLTGPCLDFIVIKS